MRSEIIRKNIYCSLTLKTKLTKINNKNVETDFQISILSIKPTIIQNPILIYLVGSYMFIKNTLMKKKNVANRRDE